MKGSAPRYTPYPKYRPSRVEWVDALPTHWDLVPVRRVIASKPGAIKTGPFGSQLLSSEMVDGPVKVYNQRNVLDQDFAAGHNYITQSKYEELRPFTVEPGDVLLTTRGTIGRCAVFPADGNLGVLHPCLMRIQVDDRRLLREYLATLIQDSPLVQTQLFLKSNATTIEVIYSDTMRQVRIPVPPIAEQRAIVEFVREETGKIDALVVKKRRLVELLEEKRTALVSHAVTKGLDPNVPMKDSGIEWFGKVPEAWRVLTVRNLLRMGTIEVQDGNHGELHPTADDYVESGIPFVMANNVRNGLVDTEGSKKITYERASRLRIGFAKPGDVLLTHKGTIGETAIVPDTLNVPFLMLTPQVTYYRVLKQTQLLITFLFVTFQSRAAREQLRAVGSEQSTRAYANILSQREVRLLLPSFEEQTAIVSWLQDRIGQIDELVATVRDGVGKLVEYRTALISAAVTGKIDVRGEVADGGLGGVSS